MALEYSQDRTVEAVKSFYQFLTHLYLPEDLLLLVPEPDGWPEITEESLAGLNKNSTVISLLKHLPYIKQAPPGDDSFCIAPATWPLPFYDVKRVQGHLAGYRGNVEPLTPDGCDELPSSMVCLAVGARTPGYHILIDTDDGSAIWVAEDKDHLPKGELELDHEVWVNSPDWWDLYPQWAVEDFFEVWKDKYRKGEGIGVSEERVLDPNPYSDEYEDEQALWKALKDAGWPGDGEGRGWDREKYNEALEKYHLNYMGGESSPT